MQAPTIDSVLAKGAPPVVAILRGLRPSEAPAIAVELVAAGIRIIEVPFNSPEPEQSVAAMARAVGDDAVIGGGTMVTVGATERLAAAGGRLMVAPNTDATVIARAIELDMEPMPGFVSATEAFTAITAGARRLKLFPASNLGTNYLRALRDVVPEHIRFWAVGGVGVDTLPEWIAAGAEGIGVGSALYRVGDGAPTVSDKAKRLVSTWAGR
jgi:2-dehydro-3-deoxyphosphogalactonate aldolase